MNTNVSHIRSEASPKSLKRYSWSITSVTCMLMADMASVLTFQGYLIVALGGSNSGSLWSNRSEVLRSPPRIFLFAVCGSF